MYGAKIYYRLGFISVIQTINQVYTDHGFALNPKRPKYFCERVSHTASVFPYHFRCALAFGVKLQARITFNRLTVSCVTSVVLKV